MGLTFSSKAAQSLDHAVYYIRFIYQHNVGASLHYEVLSLLASVVIKVYHL